MCRYVRVRQRVRVEVSKGSVSVQNAAGMAVVARGSVACGVQARMARAYALVARVRCAWCARHHVCASQEVLFLHQKRPEQEMKWKAGPGCLTVAMCSPVSR